jgi:selenocysteine lyase/cysteine desulfurase
MLKLMYFRCKKIIFFEKNFLFISFYRYGNTHSETSLCAQQSTKFREEARHLIKKSVNANENDVLLFTGTGSTGSVHTLVDNFDLHDENIRQNTVVIISAFEHHSNILPWQETGVQVKQKKNFLFFLFISLSIL